MTEYEGSFTSALNIGLQLIKLLILKLFAQLKNFNILNELVSVYICGFLRHVEIFLKLMVIYI